MPFDRYIWRLRCLEEAIVGNRLESEGIEVSSFYDDDDNDNEDSDLILYQGRLDDYGQLDHRHTDGNLNNCGYRAVNVQWEDSSQSFDKLSPWEIIVDKPTSKQHKFSRKCLAEEEKKRAHQALKKIKRVADVREQFSEPVNERRYSDYSTRVEVPMNLKFIEKRYVRKFGRNENHRILPKSSIILANPSFSFHCRMLFTVCPRFDANYYSSRCSIVFDMKLIRDNCIKYNGEVGALQDSARQMYETFEEEMLSEEERKVYNDLKTTAATPNAEESTESRSSLENLPPPRESTRSGDAGTRRSLRIRLDASNVPRQASATASSSRANPDAEEAPGRDTSFANARSRQPRRRSNDEETIETNERPRRGGAAASSSARQSSRRASLDSQSALEVVGRRSTRRTSQGDTQNGATGAAASARRPRYQEESSEDPSSGSESDAKPPARPTRGSRRAARAAEESSESEPESESEHKFDDQPSGPSARARRASLRHGAEDESPRQTRKRKARSAPSSESEEEADEDEVNRSGDEESDMEDVQSESESEVAPVARSRSASRSSARKPPASSSRFTTRASQGSRNASRRASAGKQVSYAHCSGSEFEEPESEDNNSAEDEESVPSPQKRGSRSRKAASSPAAKSRKRRKGMLVD